MEIGAHSYHLINICPSEIHTVTQIIRYTVGLKVLKKKTKKGIKSEITRTLVRGRYFQYNASGFFRISPKGAEITASASNRRTARCEPGRNLGTEELLL